MTKYLGEIFVDNCKQYRCDVNFVLKRVPV